MDKAISDLDEAIMAGKSSWRGHPIFWNETKRQWFFKDNNSPLPSHGGTIRSCKRCGKTFDGSYKGEADICLGELPGVDNACCGHGDDKKSYIRFNNGVVIRGFWVEK